MLKKLSLIINQKKAVSAGIIFFAFMIAVGLSLIFPRTCDFLNAKLNDVFFQLRYRILGPEDVDPAIIHVDLTDSDINNLALFSRDRSVYHQVLDSINDAGAAMIGVDILFHDRLNDAADEQLIVSTGKHANVYYPVVLTEKPYTSNPYPGLYERILKNPTIRGRDRTSAAKILYAPFNELIDNTKGLGHINCKPDLDGINRKIPLIFAYDRTNKTYIPGLAFRMICDYLQVTDDTIHIVFGKHIMLKDAVMPDGRRSDITIPIDNKGMMVINWVGPWDDSFSHYSTEKLLLAGIEPMFQKLLKTTFDKKIVIFSDISLKSQDQGLGIYNAFFPLSSIHSNIMNNILTGNFMKPVSPIQRIILLIGLMMMVYLTACNYRTFRFFITSIILMIFYPALNFLIFVYMKRMGYLFVPLLGMVFACIGISVYTMYLMVKDTITISERSRLKTNFFINIAHETKTPLTLIMTYLDKYIKKYGQNKELSVIRQNLNKLKVDMVNFMDAEALEMGRVIYTHDVVLNLTSIIKHKAILFRDVYASKNIEMILKLPDYDCYAKLHPAALDRIMNNLLDNALKYGKTGGRTTVTLSGTDAMVTICVRDTGIGIPIDEQEHIFKPYYQVSRDKKAGCGVGMGLYIMKKIIDEIGGFLTLQSKPGEGSAFTVTIPAAHPDSVHDIKSVMTDNGPLSVIPANMVLEEKPYDKRKRTVLVVEDDRQLLAALYSELCEDYNVLYAENGALALQKLHSSVVPDLIISDILMDEMNGYAFYKALIKNTKYHSVPFMFITAKSGHDEKIKALDMGAVAFISKPFHMDELKAEMASLIELQVSKELDYAERQKEDNKVRLNKFLNHYKISPAERRVIELVLTGKQNKEIAAACAISEATVKFHIRNVFKKCEVENRVELIYKFKE